MSISRPQKLLIAALSVALLGVMCWAGYLLFQNWIWQQAAIGYAQQSAILEANGLFRKNLLSLYKIDGKCDEAHFSGQHDGPFEVWIVFYQPSLGAAHRIVTEKWVEAYNAQMRRLQADPEKYRKRMGLDKKDDSQNVTK
jgi:hypothetical protein